jgi:hypothetical protein
MDGWGGEIGKSEAGRNLVRKCQDEDNALATVVSVRDRLIVVDNGSE